MAEYSTNTQLTPVKPSLGGSAQNYAFCQSALAVYIIILYTYIANYFPLPDTWPGLNMELVTEPGTEIWERSGGSGEKSEEGM